MNAQLIDIWRQERELRNAIEYQKDKLKAINHYGVARTRFLESHGLKWWAN